MTATSRQRCSPPDLPMPWAPWTRAEPQRQAVRTTTPELTTTWVRPMPGAQMTQVAQRPRLTLRSLHLHRRSTCPGRLIRGREAEARSRSSPRVEPIGRERTALATCGHRAPEHPRVRPGTAWGSAASGSAASGAEGSRASRPVRVTQRCRVPKSRAAGQRPVTPEWGGHPAPAGRRPRTRLWAVAVSVVERNGAPGAQRVTHHPLCRGQWWRQAWGRWRRWPRHPRSPREGEERPQPRRRCPRVGRASSGWGREDGTRPGVRCPGSSPTTWGNSVVAVSVVERCGALGAQRVTQQPLGWGPRPPRWHGPGRSGRPRDPRHARERARAPTVASPTQARRSPVSWCEDEGCRLRLGHPPHRRPSARAGGRHDPANDDGRSAACSSWVRLAWLGAARHPARGFESPTSTPCAYRSPVRARS